MSPHFYRPIRHVDMIKVDKKWLNLHRERAIRIYCIQAMTVWGLQIRAPSKRADGSDGVDFIAATATIGREDMEALRDAINASLADGQLDVAP